MNDNPPYMAVMQSLIKTDKQIHILVVDDDKTIRDFLQDGIQSAGYACSTAKSGKGALKILDAQPVDVVVSDINMPEMNGLELVERMKGKYDSGIIIMTGYAGGGTYEEIIGLGASDFIQKPIRVA